MYSCPSSRSGAITPGQGMRCSELLEGLFYWLVCCPLTTKMSQVTRTRVLLLVRRSHAFRTHFRLFLSAPKTERMATLWSAVPHVPPEITFWIGPKCKRMGFAGCVRHFEWAKLLPLDRMNDVCAAYLTDTGLTVRYPGWTLGCHKGLQFKQGFIWSRLVGNGDQLVSRTPLKF